MRIRASALALAWLALTGPPATAQDADAWRRAGREALARAQTLQPSSGKAKNLILFIGDGMGISTVTAARILEGQLRGVRTGSFACPSVTT